ncbi:DUF2970 domain-containing protein [Alteromonas stellipolaris]|uniref:DUF2970 domain-containing protein n=1 Tax=Alteromonas stellipolaris TaxID=233316 RepID=UPI0026E22F39|nr:DUF2970 domain-containing protein [Alteromonas stellipolaris]MDO6535968.1 DUF2970 domain-containing protein [Alteromonas stellipolaris]MDO6627599.1 DUF2970 domain-containing protein [Alteromonas stellipolaris]
MSQQPGTGFWSVLMSVVAGVFGVQSDKNYERDFTKGTFVSFLIIGIFLVAMMVVSLMMFVKWLTGY